MANDTKIQFACQKKNYTFLLIGLVILAIGYVLMIGGGSADPNVFSQDIFSFRRITLSPIVILIGYVVIGYAIMIKPKKQDQQTSQPMTTSNKK